MSERGPLIMAAVALLSGVGGVVLFARPTRSEAQLYRRRIFGTMLLAGCLILAMFAWSLARMTVASAPQNAYIQD